MDEKKWWKSKNIWNGIVTVLIASYETAKVSLAPELGWNLPNIPPFVYVVLGTIGVYTRATATTKVVK